jgi:sulfoacetaldehyde dehydrogenase
MFRLSTIWYGQRLDRCPKRPSMSSQAPSIDQAESLDETQRVAVLVERARAAMEGFKNVDQARADEAVTALAWSLYKPEHARELAQMAVEDTGLGNVG